MPGCPRAGGNENAGEKLGVTARITHQPPETQGCQMVRSPCCETYFPWAETVRGCRRSLSPPSCSAVRTTGTLALPVFRGFPHLSPSPFLLPSSRPPPVSYLGHPSPQPSHPCGSRPQAFFRLPAPLLHLVLQHNSMLNYMINFFSRT